MPLTTSTSMPAARRCAHFLAAAPEHERIAALEAHHALAARRLGRHQALDEGLRRARAAAALADLDDARRAARVAKHAGADQVVDQQHGRPGEWPDGLHGQQFRIAGTRADQVDNRDDMFSARRIPAGGKLLRRHRARRRVADEATHFRQARAALGAALQLGLDQPQQRVARTCSAVGASEGSDDLALADVEAGADLAPSRRHGHGRRIAGNEQRAPVRCGRELLLQQGPDPRLGGDVAGEQEALEPHRLGAARQADSAVLAAPRVGIVQARAGGVAVEAEQRLDRGEHAGRDGRRGRGAEQHAGALAAERHAARECEFGHQRSQRLAHGERPLVAEPGERQDARTVARRERP